MLADPPALEQVVFGEQGCASALCEGHTMIEMSTMGPRTIRELRFRLPKAVRLIDAPVRGSLPEAEAGALIIMVGATIKDFAIVEPLLACLGVPIRVGGPGSGAAMKLAVNLSLGGVVAALGEALALATALGVDSGIALDILGDAPWGGVIRSRRTMLERGQFPPQLRLGLATKDFHLIAEAAQATSRQVPVARAVLGWLQQAEMTFGADVDFASIIAIMNAPRDRGPEVR
jgi:3-hydroxyisobutyrate dehydrogenase-like beta-hydroxyacid dehydrogenase